MPQHSRVHAHVMGVIIREAPSHIRGDFDTRSGRYWMQTLLQVGKGEWSSIPQGPPWAVDAWGLGCLLQETFSGKTLLRAEDLRQTASIPPGILQVLSELKCVCVWCISRGPAPFGCVTLIGSVS